MDKVLRVNSPEWVRQLFRREGFHEVDEESFKTHIRLEVENHPKGDCSYNSEFNSHSYWIDWDWVGCERFLPESNQTLYFIRIVS